jgi:hypothetical protein
MSLFSPSRRALRWYLIAGGLAAGLGQVLAAATPDGGVGTFAALVGGVGWAVFLVGLIALGTAAGLRASSRDLGRNEGDPERSEHQPKS